MEHTENYNFSIFTNPVQNYPSESIPGNWQEIITQNFSTLDSILHNMAVDIAGRLLGNKLLDLTHPVGSLFFSTSDANPSSTLGGEWVAWGGGRVPVGVTSEEERYNSAEKTGGSASLVLSTENLPSHNHGLGDHTHAFSATGTAGSAGSHAHSFNASGNTGSESAHTHSVSVSGTAASAGEHNHAFQMQYNASTVAAGSSKSQVTPSPTGTSYAKDPYETMFGGAHKHSVSVSGTSGKGSSHAHTFAASGNTGSSGAHTHSVPISGTTGKSAGNTGNTGSGTAIEIVQPYITCYIWKRVA